MKKYTIVLLSLLMVSCSDFLKEQSQNEFYPETVDHYAALVLGRFTTVFSMPTTFNLMTDQLQGRIDFVYGGIEEESSSMDLFIWRQDQKVYLNSPWTTNYNIIVVMNHVIEDVDSSDGDEAEKLYVKGEAYFARAICYFALVNVFGEPWLDAEQAAGAMGVPIKTDTAVEIMYARNTLKECYDHILSDLEMAENLITRSGLSKVLYHASPKAVELFRSRVLLYMRDYEGAVAAADKALEEGELMTYPRPSFHEETGKRINQSTKIFNADNPEIIYSYGASGTAYNTGSPFYLSNEMMALFDKENDRRYLSFILETYFADASGNDPNRYLYYTSSKNVSSELFACNLRLSEAYLNRAESYARLGRLSEARAAMETLLETRCAEVTYVIPETQPELIKFVLEERQRELFLEECHRWFDLRRIGPEERPEIKHTINVRSASNVQVGAMAYTLFRDDRNYTLQIPTDEIANNPLIMNYERFDKVGVKIPMIE